jgi:hypothetical protein
MVDTNAGNNKNQFCLGWKPENGFSGHADGFTDKALLVDILGLGSKTYPISTETYNSRSRYVGVYPDGGKDSIRASWTGSLFNYFFANCWLNLKNRRINPKTKDNLDIWENNRRAIIANHQFCIDHEDKIKWDGDDCFTTYSDSSWGLTACENFMDPSKGSYSDYFAFGALPTEQVIRDSTKKPLHCGTLAVYGAGGSINFTPDESVGALRHYYSIDGLWSPLFGFGDAFSIDPHWLENTSNGFDVHSAKWFNGPWINHMLMGINEGPMLLALSNYRCGLIWSLSEKNKNISNGLDILVKINENMNNPIIQIFALHQNYPNPFNPSTTIKLEIPVKGIVSLKIYDILGREVVTLLNKEMMPGRYETQWIAGNKASGVYFYRLQAGSFVQTKKLILLR